MSAFDGRFRSQRDATSNWLPVAKEAVPEPRPGRCVDDSRTLPTMTVNFIKTHTLMETAVKSMNDRPLLTRVNLKHSFTAITVDPQIRGLDGNFYDVIFVGTDDGRVLKFANIFGKNASSAKTTIITETQVLGTNQPVRQLSVSKSTGNLIVVGDGRIVATPLHHCKKITHCCKCLSLQDPYCSWDIRSRECTNVDFSSDDASVKVINFIQKLRPLNVDLCRKHGELCEMDHHSVPNAVQSKRGGAGGDSVGRALPEESFDDFIIELDDGNDMNNDISSISIVDSSLSQDDLQSRHEPHTGSLHMGSPSMVVLACVLFVAGITAGVVMSRLRHKFSPCYNEHRNQINSYVISFIIFKPLKIHNICFLLLCRYVHKPLNLQALNSGKDINLLANPYSCHPKKENLEQEFSTKDRSHECKNSTENLDKADLHYKGGLSNSDYVSGGYSMGTLPNCKKTYL